MTIVHHLIVLFLILVFPIWDRHETRLLKSSADPRVRRRSYQKTIVWQLLVTALLFLTLPAARLFAPPLTLADLGLGAVDVPIGPILVGLLVGGAMSAFMARRAAGGRPRPNPLQGVAFFLPRGRAERGWFLVMCIVVGVCEEVIFRGFLIRYLLEFPLQMGAVSAVVSAAAIFGIDHGYQGWPGIFATTVLALVFTFVFLATGSLWIPMILHAALDLRILFLAIPELEPVED